MQQPFAFIIQAFIFTAFLTITIFGNPPIRYFLNRIHVLPQETPPTSDQNSKTEVFKGGRWIGILERVAIYACIIFSFPSGIAMVLAIKGLGRYPELHNEKHHHMGELFIIGTFTSALWALMWAGIAHTLIAFID